MGFAITATVTYESCTCSECGLEIFAPDNFWRERRRNHGKNFYCPNGHAQVFTGETEAQKLARQLKTEQERSAELRAIADRKDRPLIAAKGQQTKLRKRIQNGVCPCCHRVFVALARHMATKHPDFKPEDLGPKLLGPMGGE